MRRIPSGGLGGGALAFSLGVLGVLWAPWLLPVTIPVLGLAGAVLLPPRSRWLALCLLLGTSWSLLEATQRLDARWPADRHGEDVQLRGVVADIPEARGEDWRFRFRPDHGPVAGDIRVSWYRAEQALSAGDCLDLELRMRTPRGSVSPGSFDYERWLLVENYAATAYVRDAEACGRRAQPWWKAARSRLDARLGAWLDGHPGLPLLRALSLGNRNDIESADWQALRVTGTSHLLAISGLHVGLVAGLFLFAGRWLWRRSARLCTWLPAPRAGVLIGSLAALAYAALAGFAVPTQRALLMWSVLAIALWAGRPVNPLRVLLLAWMVVLLADPLAVLSAGTWLSFIAVAAIVLVSADRAAGLRAWLRIPRMQLALLAALAPATLLFFQGASLMAPVVNAIAIPLFGLLLPLLLISLLIAVAMDAPMVLVPAVEALSLLRDLLHWTADVADVLWLQAAPGGWGVASAAIGAALLLAPQAIPLRGLAVLAFLPLLWPAPKLAHGQFELAVLDVGQGLASVVRTREHTLVYDAGPAWPGGFDAGEAIVVPWLRARGVQRVDHLLLSHAHNDHEGGIDAVINEFPVDARYGMADAPPCERGLSWRWDGVDFEVLHPSEAEEWDVNNISCVLRVSAGGDSALLTGDIEAPGERGLLRAAPAAYLDVDVVVAPHHGSRTSSTPTFVTTTRPELVLIPAGWRNRYDHPHEEVIARWERTGAQLHKTGAAGSLWLRLGEGVATPELRRGRDTRRIWRAPPTPPRARP